MQALIQRAESQLIRRRFPFSEATDSEEVLEHLNLLRKGKPTYACLLLFGTSPQRFVLSSEIKCAHFHDTETAKPIPSYQVYKGTVFELVDQALDFIYPKSTLPSAPERIPFKLRSNMKFRLR